MRHTCHLAGRHFVHQRRADAHHQCRQGQPCERTRGEGPARHFWVRLRPLSDLGVPGAHRGDARPRCPRNASQCAHGVRHGWCAVVGIAITPAMALVRNRALAVALFLVLCAGVVGQPVPDPAGRARHRGILGLPDHGIGAGASPRGRGHDWHAARSFDGRCARSPAGPAYGCSPQAGVVEASDQPFLDRTDHRRACVACTGACWQLIPRPA